MGLAKVSLEGALEKAEHDGACYFLRRVLSLASASWSLPPVSVRYTWFSGGIRRQLFILESSYLHTSISDDSNLPEEAAVRDLGIQRQSAPRLLQDKT